MNAHALRRCLGPIVFGLTIAHVSADTTLTTCTESALDTALIAGGRIVVSCDGTITLGSTKVIALDTTLDASGQLTLSGGGTTQLFTINPGVTLTLHRLTLARGNYRGADGSDGGELEDGDNGRPGFGGALFNDGGTLVAVEVTFATNKVAGGNGGQGTAGQFLGANGRDGGRGGIATGGAILNRSGQLFLTNCTFISNEAQGGTGGLGGDGLISSFNGNGGDGGDGGFGRGGAIYSEGGGQLVLVDCTFADNRAAGGTAGEPGLAGGGVTFDGSMGSAAGGEGGALFADTGSVVGLRSTLNRNSVRGADGLGGLNGFERRVGMKGGRGASARGGAVAVENGTAAFTNSTWYANTAAGGTGGDGGTGGEIGFGGDGGDGGDGGSAAGGSVYLSATSAGSFVNCSLSAGTLTNGMGGMRGEAGADTANSGDNGSAGRAEGANIATDSDAVVLLFTLLAYGQGDENAYGHINDGGFNISSDNSPAYGHEASLNEIDPLLGTLADNGGPTRTLALNPASPARDRGGNVRWVDTDQRGLLRVGAVDVGAYEYRRRGPSGRRCCRVVGQRLLAGLHTTETPGIHFVTPGAGMATGQRNSSDGLQVRFHQ